MKRKFDERRRCLLQNRFKYFKYELNNLVLLWKNNQILKTKQWRKLFLLLSYEHETQFTDENLNKLQRNLWGYFRKILIKFGKILRKDWGNFKKNWKNLEKNCSNERNNCKNFENKRVFRKIRWIFGKFLKNCGLIRLVTKE